MASRDDRSPATLAAQALHTVDAQTGAIVPPLHTSTTYARTPDYALIGGGDYTRDLNPTYVAAEALLARLEGGAEAMLFSSGMAAATLVFRALLKRGDHVVAPIAMYFGVRTWLRAFAADHGVELDLIDMAAPAGADAIARAVRPGVTKLVWVETPANPTWDVTDLRAAADLAHAAGALPAVGKACAGECAPGGYCQFDQTTGTGTCTATKADGQACQSDSECNSSNCDTTTNLCAARVSCA